MLGLFLGVHQGDFLGEYRELLRFYDPDGTLVPYPTEAEEAERQEKERERQQRERAEAENEVLRQRLRELGVDPDDL